MWITSSVTRALRAILFSLWVVFFAPAAFAQSPAIQPCEAAPSPATSPAPTPATKVATRLKEISVDSSIVADPAVEKTIAPYTEKVRALTVVIGTLENELQTGGIGANTMGSFVVDALFSQAKVKTGRAPAVAITNAGGLRKKIIAPGELRVSDIFELLPFENTLIELDLTGSQLLTLLQRVITARDPQAGARIEFRWNEQNRPEFMAAKLIDADGRERNIDPKATYTILIIDYLLQLKSGNYAILQEAKNVTPLNLTIRDAVIDYVKAENSAKRAIRAHLDDRFKQIGPGPNRSTEKPND